MRKLSMTGVLAALVLSAGMARPAEAQGTLSSELHLCIQPVGSWDGAQITQTWPCSISNSMQYWSPASVPGANGFHIVNWGTGKCLDDTDGSTADWTPVQQWTCNNTSTSMLWKWGPGGNAGYPGQGAMLINVRSGKCLDVRNGSDAPGTLIQIYRCMGWYSDGTPNRAQFWYFYNYY
jgi:ricin-type beta-trefoil lectin protein